MSNDTVVRARIDRDTKARATEALKAMGLTVSDVIRLVLFRVAEEKRLPFIVKVPNATTVEAMKAGMPREPSLTRLTPMQSSLGSPGDLALDSR